MDNRLNGLNPLAYMGVAPLSVAQLIYKTFDPTTNDSQNFQIGAVWINTVSDSAWILVSLAKGVATWVMFAGGTGDVLSLTGNNAVSVFPLGGNINVVGDTTTINIVGNAGTHTLTASASGAVAISFPTDGGIATPSAGVLNVFGGTAGRDINTSGSGNTIHVDLKNTITLGDLANAAGTFALLAVTGNIGTTNGTYQAGNTANSNTSSLFQFVKSRSGGVITTGDPLGSIQWYGFDGTSNVLSAAISAVTSGTIGTNRVASSLQFFTHPDSGSSLAQRVVIGSTGTVTINTPDSGNALFANGFVVAQNDITTNAGNIILPATTSTSQGILSLGGFNVLHCFGANADANVFVGQAAGNFTLTTGTAVNNTGVGNSALHGLTTGANNAAIGVNSQLFVTTGNHNASCGTSTLGSLVTGAFNAALGYTSGGAYTGSESSNVSINNGGTIGDNNVLRIGAATGTGNQQLNKAFICGIRGITTGNADAIAVLVDSANQLGTVSSSIRFKENIQDMGSYSNLLLNLRPVKFNYKEDVSKRTSYGLIAEEVESHMPDLVVYGEDRLPMTLKYHEMPAIIINELQRLNNRIAQLEKLSHSH